MARGLRLLHGARLIWPRIDGFDDGYDVMGELEESCGRCDAKSGDWPYVLFLVWPALEPDLRWCIAHYCEGDFGVEVFESEESCSASLMEIQKSHPCP